MDYKNKYKEALAIVKSMVADGIVAQDVAEKYFHELAESEDEKIRKCLHEVFIQYLADEWYGLDVKDILAWLEKQGEQKPSTHKYNVGATIYYNSFGTIKSMVVANVVDTGDGNPMYKDVDGGAVFEKAIVEQKPVEWSEEDEKELNWIISVFDSNNNISLGAYERAVKWLKSLKDRVQPQSKQEWSEEDEEMIDSLIGNIQYLNDIAATDNATAKSRIDWLKSLHPQKQ